METANHATLDLFSTSPTKTRIDGISALQERQSKTFPCIYNAPFFGYQIEGKLWAVTQGNCHHWDCPRCGLGRAKHEYGRMVEGCRKLGEKFPLYFITITCRGKEISSDYADQHYGEWTNRLLDASRSHAKRKDCEWSYVQVTERQKRGHPHSHFITTFRPADAVGSVVRKWKVSADGSKSSSTRTSYRSLWFEKRLKSAGLGEQYEITKVDSSEAASRYVAKYLFKPTIFASDWPEGWKRIRYSQSFPRAQEQETNAIVLLSQEDWYRLSENAAIVTVTTIDDFEEVSNRLHFHDTIVRLKSK